VIAFAATNLPADRGESEFSVEFSVEFSGASCAYFDFVRFLCNRTTVDAKGEAGR